MAIRRTRPVNDEDYVTVPGAAALLDVSASTIWRWIARGELPAYRIGRRFVRLKRDDVTGMIRSIRGRDATDAGRSTPSPRYLTLADPDHIWAGYDPEEVRRGLREDTGFLTPEEADRLIADLYRAREAGSRPITRP